MNNQNGRTISINGRIGMGEAAGTSLLTLTHELEAALVSAYYCCRKVGSRNESDDEIEANQAADCIALALRAHGVNL